MENIQLETRKCKRVACDRIFRVMPKSHHWHCSIFCKENGSSPVKDSSRFPKETAVRKRRKSLVEE